jgi:hypothetical protein
MTGNEMRAALDVLVTYMRRADEALAKNDMDSLEVALVNAGAWARKLHGGETTMARMEREQREVRRAEEREERRLRLVGR